MAFPPFRETEEMDDYARENFRWHWRKVSHLRRPLSENYRELYPHFVLSKAEDAVRDFELPEMRERQRKRRKMILFPNFTSTEQATEYVRDTFRWSLRESLALCPNPLPEDYHGLFLGFDLSMVTQYAHDSNISEMVQAIFYAMVLNNTAELGLSCRIDMNCIISILRCLNWNIMETWLWGIELRL
ncbi:hypothetical protein Cgig2_023995 [Carnegiea gigantea]|uniref:Uncharacterized protein n=1 Tax=Carnegiea gigantea TaxID=171969 RepID=A0A9Q1KC46_9CARY|nr:hypothetical protein Cgig2_023995 [Carnegiea gigantea]